MPVSKARPGDCDLDFGRGQGLQRPRLQRRPPGGVHFRRKELGRAERVPPGQPGFRSKSGTRASRRCLPCSIPAASRSRISTYPRTISGKSTRRQNTGDNFEYQGKLWNYRFSREVRSSRDGVPGPAFYCWRFLEEGGARAMTIRKPEGERVLRHAGDESESTRRFRVPGRLAGWGAPAKDNSYEQDIAAVSGGAADISDHRRTRGGSG